MKYIKPYNFLTEGKIPKNTNYIITYNDGTPEQYGYFQNLEVAVKVSVNYIRFWGIKELTLIKLSKSQSNVTNKKDKKYLIKWYGNDNYWLMESIKKPELFDKYLFGIEQAYTDIISKLNYSTITFIKRYLTTEFPDLWNKLLKNHTDLDKSATMGEMGFSD